MGIEPTTYSLGSCRSTTELRPRAGHHSQGGSDKEERRRGAKPGDAQLGVVMRRRPQRSGGAALRPHDAYFTHLPLWDLREIVARLALIN
jgi:hypothetical protein